MADLPTPEEVAALLLRLHEPVMQGPRALSRALNDRAEARDVLADLATEVVALRSTIERLRGAREATPLERLAAGPDPAAVAQENARRARAWDALWQFTYHRGPIRLSMVGGRDTRSRVDIGGIGSESMAFEFVVEDEVQQAAMVEAAKRVGFVAPAVTPEGERT